jgi:hypothetical protein
LTSRKYNFFLELNIFILPPVFPRFNPAARGGSTVRFTHATSLHTIKQAEEGND